MSAVPSWAELLPRFAERVAVDSGRGLAEVTALLDRVHGTPAHLVTDGDVVELVEMLTPTMVRVAGPVMASVVARADHLPRESRVDALAPWLAMVMPVLAAEVMSRGGRHADR